MKNYKQIILKYMKTQYKRTISVATAIVLATALIICVLALNKSNSKNAIEEAEYSYGKQHAVFSGLEERQLPLLGSNHSYDAYGKSVYLGCGKLKNNLSIYIEGYDLDAIKLDDYKIAKGNLPKHDNEIAVEKWMLDNLRIKHKLGQKLAFDIENTYRDENYKYHTYKTKAVFKLVGILKDNRLSKMRGGQGEALTTIKTVKKMLPKDFLKYSATVRLKGNKNILGRLDKIKKQISNKKILLKPNMNLIFQYEISNGEGEDSINSGESLREFMFNNLPVLIAVLMIIYNIFNISVLGRMKDFGIMRAIGAKASQIRLLIYGEAIVTSLFAIPIGVALGLIGAKGFMFFNSKDVDKYADVIDKVYLPLNEATLAIIMVLIAVVLAVIIPAHKAGKVSPLEIINGSTEGMKNKKMKTGKIYNFSIRNFGIGFNIACQNIWRCKRRFFLTVFCMCICGALFFQNRSYHKMLDFMIEKEIKLERFNKPFIGYNANYNIETFPGNMKSSQSGYSEKDYKDILTVDGIKNIEVNKCNWNTKIIMNKANIKKEYIKFLNMQHYEQLLNGIDKKGIVSATVGYQSKDLIKNKNFLVSGKVDVDKMQKEPVILLVNQLRDNGYHKTYTISNLKVGDVIKVSMPYKQGNRFINKIQKLKIGGILNGYWYFGAGGFSGGTYMNPQIILHNDMMKKLTNTYNYQKFNILMKDKADFKKASLKFKEISMRINDGFFRDNSAEDQKMRNYAKQEDMIKNAIFLSLIIIAIINIFNTMSTNLMLRTREFGLLKVVGITDRQLKNMILMEGLIYALASVVFSTIIGFMLTYKDFVQYSKLYSMIKNFEFKISFMAIGIIIIANIFFSLLSTIAPLRKLIKLNPIESTRMVE